ncbi:MAG: class I SAM-dependent methyltransferase [Candidatus Moraniibacteriota bacterium]
MQNLPTADVYDKEYKYMPWGVLIEEILKIIREKTPKGGKVLDLMCGTGHLLGKIRKIRPDLELTGLDWDPGFIRYAKKNYKNINFIVSDALEWKNNAKYDLIICTAGIHHLPYDKQEIFIKNLSKAVKKDGYIITADPYIEDYKNESERKIAGAKLGYEYLVETIKNGATGDVIKATVGIMENDVMGVEYKASIRKFNPILKKFFSKITIRKTWPEYKSDYGDYYFILHK